MIDDQNWKSKECDNHGARTTQLRSGRGYHAISIRLRDELEKIWMLWARYLWHWNTELFLCSRQRGMTIFNWFLLWEGMFTLQLKTPKNQLIYHFLYQFWGCKTWYNPTSLHYILFLNCIWHKMCFITNTSTSVEAGLSSTCFSHHSWLSSPQLRLRSVSDSRLMMINGSPDLCVVPTTTSTSRHSRLAQAEMK